MRGCPDHSGHSTQLDRQTFGTVTSSKLWKLVNNVHLMLKVEREKPDGGGEEGGGTNS